MYYVQRLELSAAPEVVGERLQGVMSSLGYRAEAGSVLPCCRFSRGKAANGWVALSPANWGVVVDTRVERTAAGGSTVDLAWTMQTTGQLVSYSDTHYWQLLMRHVRDVLAGKPSDVGGVLRLSRRLVWLSVAVIVLLTPAVLLAAFGFGTNTASRLAIALGVFAFLSVLLHDWRRFSER